MWWSGRIKPEKAISTINMPNGAHWYQLEELPKNNPESFKALSFPFLKEEKEREELIRRLNTEMTSPSSSEKCVYSLIVDDDGLLTPVAENTYPLTAPKNSFRWEEFIANNFHPTNEEGINKLKEYVDQRIPKIDSYFMSEPKIATLAFPWLNSALEAEYICKAGFIEACLDNQWLMPYANRLSWRFVDGNASIIVPYWKGSDLSHWHEIEFKESSSTGFLMSDGKRYPYPQDMEINHPDIFTSKKNTIKIDNEEINISDALFLKYPKVNRKQTSVARIAKEIEDGLIPFDPPYPVVELEDADQRVRAEIAIGLTIIYIEPNKFIVGKHSPEHYDKALSKYRELWKKGELLNDFGHVNYTDPYSEIDERAIVQLNLNDNDL